jgi:RNA polymerase sigma-70 factor (ECF subfamily)
MMPVMTLDPVDPSLVRNAQNGNADARGRLVEEIYRRLFSYSMRLTRGNTEEAMDIAQEAAYRFLSSLAGLREPQRLISWILRIATNVWRDRLRGRQDYPLTQDVEDPSSHDSVEKDETLLELLRRLDELPAVYRIALTLRFLKGLDYEAMGEVLDVSQATLRMQVARGIRLLREQMDGRAPS